MQMNIQSFFLKYLKVDLMTDLGTMDNVWITTKIGAFDSCIETDYDASFYDIAKRVENKYNSMPDYKAYVETENKENLDAYKDLASNKRVPVLGTTEYLFPFVHYSLKSANDSTQNEILPFIIYAPLEWSHEDNIKTVDCFGNGFKNGTYNKLVIFLPKDTNKWIDSAENWRVTIFEMYRLHKILGNETMHVDDTDKDKFILRFSRSVGGGKRVNIKKSKSFKINKMRKKNARKSRKSRNKK
jgi:hypothetical protein